MLVLSRKPGEKIVLGDPSNPLGFIEVVSVRGEKVRLGVQLPTDVQVHREEVADDIARGVRGAQAVAP